jgi:phosphoribosylamine--glycine ligase
VGPELPLTLGLVDELGKRGLLAFGPNKLAAELEGSKAFSKNFMKKYGIPTAQAEIATTREEAEAALKVIGLPCVFKADGLASGKGVVVLTTREDAERALKLYFDERVFGTAGDRVLVEKFIDGDEVSFMALCDGERAIPLATTKDYKKVFDGDRGPNTGGMGAYTPLPWAPSSLVDEITETVLQPTVDEMARRGTPFRGLLYAGLALTSRGLRVVEFNARFGDPETQPILALLDSPLSPLLLGAAEGTLADVPPPTWKPGAAVAVVMASKGYPETSSNGDVIVGTETLDRDPQVQVLHAGTAIVDGHLVTAGGRVLAVTATGSDVADARAQAYEGIAIISFPGAQWRRDIAAGR